MSPFSWISGVAFAESFLVYSWLRHYDAASTKLAAERIDIRTNEVNPLITRLTGRWGLDRALKIMWLPTACLIASLDMVINTASPVMVPAFALIFGTAHIQAAANNTELYHQLKDTTKEQLVLRNFLTAQELSGLNWRRRLSTLVRRNTTAFTNGLLTLLGLVGLMLDIGFGDYLSRLTGLLLFPTAIAYASFALLFGLLIFQMFKPVAILLLSRRLVTLYRRGELVPGHLLAADGYVEFPVSSAEKALKMAKENNASTIRIELDNLPEKFNEIVE